MPDTQFLTHEETAVALGVTPEEVDALVEAKELTPVVMSTGGAAVYWPAQVAALAVRAANELTLAELKKMTPQQVASLPEAKIAAALAKPKADAKSAPAPTKRPKRNYAAAKQAPPPVKLSGGEN